MPGVQHVATGPAERPTHAAQSQLHTAADLRGGRETQKQMHVSPPGGPTRARRHRGGTHGSVKRCRKTQGKNFFLFFKKKKKCCCTVVALADLAAGLRAKRPSDSAETRSQQFTRRGRRRSSRAGVGEPPLGFLFGPAAADRSQN